MRCTGKTTILFQLIHELIKKGIDPRRILYLFLDHPALQEFSLEEILEIYRNNVYAGEDLYLFLDEIHKILWRGNPLPFRWWEQAPSYP